MPDKGSVNPFLPGGSRTGGPRNYTFHVVSGGLPEKRAKNTIYTQTTDPDTRLGMSIRNYIPDRGRDGTGDVGLPKLVLNLADGSKVRGDAACAMLDPIEDVSTSTFPPALWKNLVAAAVDPVNAPASDPPSWERFWNASYSVAGIFIDDMDLRAATYPPNDRAAFSATPIPDTCCPRQPQVRSIGHGLGKDADLPEDPARGYPLETARPQVRYWSMCSGSSPVTGLGYDCVYDQQVPLGRVAVIPWWWAAGGPATQRPRACGYRWMNFGKPARTIPIPPPGPMSTTST